MPLDPSAEIPFFYYFIFAGWQLPGVSLLSLLWRQAGLACQSFSTSTAVHTLGKYESKALG